MALGRDEARHERRAEATKVPAHPDPARMVRGDGVT